MNDYNFSDFGIKPKTKSFAGEKIKAKNILNMAIKVFDFKTEPSKIKPGTEYLMLQIEKGGDKRIVMTGSIRLIDQIRQVPTDKFPFTTTIILKDESYEFT